MSDQMTLKSPEFSISAETWTIFPVATHQENSAVGSLFLSGQRFVIPVYQRAYSWKEDNIRKLVTDLVRTFQEREAFFIGTVQLQPKNQNDTKKTFDIIDGQQRATTILLLLKVLQHRGATLPDAVDFELLSTEVGIDTEQQKLRAFFEMEGFPERGAFDAGFNPAKNRYLENARLLQDELYNRFEIWDASTEDAEDPGQFIQDFADWLAHAVQFVVIKTTAGLSKTLQIFDAINTTGLDLGGADLFKIRMFEYLSDPKYGRDNDGKSNLELFAEIDALYALVNLANKRLRKEGKSKGVIFTIDNVLRTYQLYLIGKYKLSAELYKMWFTTFFERLFDQILGLKDWHDFRTAAKIVKLELEDLRSLIESRFQYEATKYNDAAGAFSLAFIWKSRYPRYYDLVLLYFHRFHHQPIQDILTDPVSTKLPDDFDQFVKALSKYYYFKSMQYNKVVNAALTESHHLLNELMEPAVDDRAHQHQIIQKARRMLLNTYWWEYSPTFADEMRRLLNGPIATNHNHKYMTCQLTAFLAESEEEHRNADTNWVWTFMGESHRWDIEHIRAVQSKAELEGPEEDRLGDAELHKIGNLILLERPLNIAIGNKNHVEKASEYLNYGGKGSRLKIVRDLAGQYPDNWTKADATARRERLTQQIIDYMLADGPE